MHSFRFALFFFLFVFTLPCRADQNDPRLDDLFEQLKKISDPVDASLVEAQIWQIWVEHENPEFRSLMISGIRHMGTNQLGLALADFDRLVNMAPEFAEAWNKRATIHWLLGNYSASEADIAKTLALEPFHFGALSGRSLVALAQRDYIAARNALQSILEFYPAMAGVRENLQEIDNYLRSSAI